MLGNVDEIHLLVFLFPDCLSRSLMCNSSAVITVFPPSQSLHSLSSLCLSPSKCPLASVVSHIPSSGYTLILTSFLSILSSKLLKTFREREATNTKTHKICQYIWMYAFILFSLQKGRASILSAGFIFKYLFEVIIVQQREPYLPFVYHISFLGSQYLVSSQDADFFEVGEGVVYFKWYVFISAIHQCLHCFRKKLIGKHNFFFWWIRLCSKKTWSQNANMYKTLEAFVYFCM